MKKLLFPRVVLELKAIASVTKLFTIHQASVTKLFTIISQQLWFHEREVV